MKYLNIHVAVFYTKNSFQWLFHKIFGRHFNQSIRLVLIPNIIFCNLKISPRQKLYKYLWQNDSSSSHLLCKCNVWFSIRTTGQSDIVFSIHLTHHYLIVAFREKKGTMQRMSNPEVYFQICKKTTTNQKLKKGYCKTDPCPFDSANHFIIVFGLSSPAFLYDHNLVSTITKLSCKRGWRR